MLNGYGIPVENNPITYSGNVKNVYLSQWLKLRFLIESNGSDSPFQHNNYNSYNSTMIECPYLTDILFQKGTGTLRSTNVGNIKLRQIIESKTIECGCFDMNYHSTTTTDTNSNNNF